MLLRAFQGWMVVREKDIPGIIFINCDHNSPTLSVVRLVFVWLASLRNVIHRRPVAAWMPSSQPFVVGAFDGWPGTKFPASLLYL